MFKEINKITIKFYSHLRYINRSYYLKSQIPTCHRQFFRVISQNRKYVDNFCKDRNNPFHFACQKWIKIVCDFFFSILFLFQHNLIISQRSSV